VSCVGGNATKRDDENELPPSPCDELYRNHEKRVNVILSDSEESAFTDTYTMQILRPTPQDDIATPSRRGRVGVGGDVRYRIGWLWAHKRFIPQASLGNA
jgi:hypothetical protein